MTSQLQKLFEEMNREMMLKEKMILSDIQFNEKKQLADITKVKKEVEQRRDEAAQHLQSLQKMRAQQDIFLFFKVSSGILLFFMNMPISQPGALSGIHTNCFFPFFWGNPVCRNLNWPRTGMFHLKTLVFFFEKIWC